jgi:hypothetical protein
LVCAPTGEGSIAAAHQIPNAIHRKTLFMHFAAAPIRTRGCEIGAPYLLAQRTRSMHRRSVVSTYKAMPRFVKESRLRSTGPSQPTFASRASIC